MKILALTKYAYEGPSSRYRFYNYRDCFKKNDITLEIKPFFAKSYFMGFSKIQKIGIVLLSYMRRVVFFLEMMLFKNRYDLFLIEYELFPYFPAWFEYLLKLRGIKYMVDYDDAIFHKYDMSKNKLIRMLLTNKIAKVMAYADEVIVCNAYLESYAKKHNKHTFKIPTVVLLDTYKEKMDTFQKPKEDVFVIGWIGSRTTCVYIREILPAIEKFVETYSKTRIDLVGFDRALLTEDEIVKCHLNIIDWSEEKEIENILTFDVGIMPLHDDAWSQGKCGFKLVQYMSCKKPVIASPVGVNCTLVRDDENGFLVDTVEEWFLAFEKLYLDVDLRKKMAENNFCKIETEYNHALTCKMYMYRINKIINVKKRSKC